MICEGREWGGGVHRRDSTVEPQILRLRGEALFGGVQPVRRMVQVGGSVGPVEVAEGHRAMDERRAIKTLLRP